MSDYRNSDDEISENFSNGETTLRNDDTKSEMIVPTINKMHSEQPQNPLLYNKGKFFVPKSFVKNDALILKSKVLFKLRNS